MPDSDFKTKGATYESCAMFTAYESAPIAMAKYSGNYTTGQGKTESPGSELIDYFLCARGHRIVWAHVACDGT